MADIISSFIFSFVTSLREVLEAALIIGIVAGYLTKINRRDLHRDVTLGAIFAIILSFILSAGLILLIELTGTDYQELIEGVIMLIAAGVLSWMILWMWKQSRLIKSDLESKVDQSISNGTRWGVVTIVFFAVFREGAELILLLFTSYARTEAELGVFYSLVGVGAGFVLGLVIASVMAIILFRSTINLNLKKFFNVTSIILIVFAAGLVAHGIHEIFEFLEVSYPDLAALSIFDTAWNINNTPIGSILETTFGWMYDSSQPMRFEKSTMGLILTGLFGWNDNPAIIEALAYVLYYIVIGLVYFYIKNKPTADFTKNKATN